MMVIMGDVPVVPTPGEEKPLWSARALHDLTLIETALAGQANAYEQLVVRYRKSVYHTIFQIVRHPDDADDLTSVTFAKAFRNLPHYRPDFAFSTWLFRIATNSSIDFLRRQRVKTVSLHQPHVTKQGEAIAWDVLDPDPTPQEELIRQQRGAVARQVVELLPPKYARLVRLRYFDEPSYEEVAAELKLPLGTVKAQLFKARQLMLELLQQSQASL